MEFRGRRKDNGEWVHGWYVKDWTGGAHIITEFGPNIAHCEECGANDQKSYEVDPETVEQYTGMKDRNGKEIYEREAEKQKPVVLPREVADALEQAKKWSNGSVELVAWFIPLKESRSDYWKVLFDYGNQIEGGFFKLIDAIRYGYEIEEPQTFQTNRKLDVYEIRDIRNYYKSAVKR